MTNKKLFALLFSAVLAVGAGVTATTFTSSALETKAAGKTYTFSNYAAGTQYASNEEHVLDDDITVYTTECHFTSELRIYSSSSHNGFAIIESKTKNISSISFNAGNKSDTLNVLGCDTIDGEYTLIEGVKVNSSYADVSVSKDFSYKYLKLDVSGTQQVRLKSMTIELDSPLSVDKTVFEGKKGDTTVVTATSKEATPTFTWSVTEGTEVVGLTDVADHPEQKTLTILNGGKATVKVSDGKNETTISVNAAVETNCAGAKELEFGDLVVATGIVGSYKYGKSFSIYDTDGTGLYVYPSTELNLVAGTKATIYGKLSSYQGLRQLVPTSVVSSETTEDTYTARTLTEVTTADVGDYVEFKDVLLTSKKQASNANSEAVLTFKVGETTVTVYSHKTNSANYFTSFNETISTFVANQTKLNVKGTLQYHATSGIQIYLTSDLEIEECLPDTTNLLMLCETILSFDCTEAGTPAMYQANWVDFGGFYATLSNYEKNLFKTATANAEGTTVEQAAARYDLVVTKYGLTDFAERAPAAASMNLGLINNTFNPTLIFVIAGIALAASVVTVVTVKKAKKAN